MIRSLCANDVASVWTAFHDKPGFSTGGRIRFYDEAELEYWATDPQAQFLVSEEKGVYQAFSFTKFISPSWALIDGFFVIPEYRILGLGKALLWETERRISAKNIEYVCTLVESEDVRQWLIKRGYTLGKQYHWLEKWLPVSESTRPRGRLGFDTE